LHTSAIKSDTLDLIDIKTVLQLVSMPGSNGVDFPHSTEGPAMNKTAYRQLQRNEFEFQYNPRVSVPEFPQLAKKRAEESRRAKATLKSWLNVPYGKSARERLDIYAAQQAGGAVLIYIHGGYWRSGSKDDNANFVPPFVQRGATAVLVEYDLCPAVTVTDIVRQTRAAIVWVYRNIASHGGDPSKLYISGHSAGGHLTAMALAHDWRKEGLPPDIIKGALASSGVYDMDMVMHVSANEEIRMTPDLARENNPFAHPPLPLCPVIVAVGGAEPEGWKQMSKDYFELCKEHRLKCQYLEVPGANHYTMSEHLGDPQSPLHQAVLKLMSL
jgi:arylformamidase